MPSSPSQRDTSLPEVSVVVAVIAVLATMTAPALQRAWQSYGLTAAAAEVRTALHRTRIRAVMGNQDCRVRVTSAATYLIECETPDWTPIAFYRLGKGFTITANNRPEFHPMGNVAPMATITVWNERGQNRRIITSRGGRIRTE